MAQLCNDLKKLTSVSEQHFVVCITPTKSHRLQVSSEHLYETTLAYKDFVKKIFEYQNLVQVKKVPRKRNSAKRDATDKSELSANENDANSSEDLQWKIEAVLARLVSDYRAIFAIEEQTCLLR